MKKKLTIAVLTIVLCFLSSNSYAKNTLYEDETYSLYYSGNKIWMEIGDIERCSNLPQIVYTPNENMDSWRKTATKDNGIYDEDISFKKLPFPFGLLLASDMVYINKIIYYEEEKASITFFNWLPLRFLVALLTKVKNM